MRGKPNDADTFNSHRRITPADAGKTSLQGLRLAVDKDHPRGCGENKLNVAVIAYISGSPPRMRGKRVILSKFTASCRITPADAGKTTA